MLVEKTIGTIADYPGLEVEYVLLDWHESHRRIIKKRLASGEDIGIRLSEADAAKGLNQGDVLGVIDEKTVIVVRIAPVEALMIQVASASMIPKLAFEMGNKHAPFFKGDQPTEFFSPLDLPLKALLESIPGVAVKEGRVVLNKERAISSSTGGGHSHDHGNDHAHHDHDHAHHGHDHGHDHADHGQDHADHGHDHGNDHDSHVLVVDAGSEAMIPKVAFEVGNSHAPFYFGDQPTEFLTPNSAQVRAMLQRLHGVTVRVGHTQPDPDKAISATGGGHGTPEEDGGYDGKGGTRLEGSFYEDSHQQSEHCHCHDPNADHQH